MLCHFFAQKLINMRKITALALLLSMFLYQCDSEDKEPVPVPEITITAPTLSIDENPEQGAVIGTIPVDVVNGTDVTLAITSQTPADAVSLNANNELVVNDASIFDFEVNESISVTLSATVDEVTESATLNIAINNLADYVGFNSDSHTYTIKENTLSGEFEETLSDLLTAEQGLNYSFDYDENLSPLLKGDARVFDFNNLTGLLEFWNSGNWDFEEITGFTSEGDGLKTWSDTIYILDVEGEVLDQMTLNIQIEDVEGENEFDERVNHQGQTISQIRNLIGSDIYGQTYKGGRIIRVNADYSVVLVAPEKIEAGTYSELVAAVESYSNDGNDEWYIPPTAEYRGGLTYRIAPLFISVGQHETIVTSKENGEHELFLRYYLGKSSSGAIVISHAQFGISANFPFISRPISLVDKP